MSKKKPLTMEDVNRIKSATAKANEGKVPKDSFAARAEGAVTRRTKDK